MTQGLAQRRWILFTIAVIASGAYFAAVEVMPEHLRVNLKALPSAWLVPGVACCVLYALTWRNETAPLAPRYLRIAAYGYAAPPIALLVIAVVYAVVLGANP